MNCGALQSIRRFVKSEDGPTAIEYAVMLGVVVIFCLAVLFNLGEVQNGIWEESSEAMSGMNGGN